MGMTYSQPDAPGYGLNPRGYGESQVTGMADHPW